jgi:uncharacterized protein YecA (UPF0149 family)
MQGPIFEQVPIDRIFVSASDNFPTYPTAVASQPSQDNLRIVVNKQGTVVKQNRLGRNEKCYCGSMKKFKHCCMRAK